ncbi:MAG: hypothetical protein KC506_01905 [Nanoarchaeota archaeon]|nr:hypothetical protein [Nanoarchaeota archaeon]
MKIYISIIKFLFLGSLFIISNQNLYMNDSTDRHAFYTEFNSWLDTLFAHALQITGYVVDSEWLPKQGSDGPLEGVVK